MVYVNDETIEEWVSQKPEVNREEYRLLAREWAQRAEKGNEYWDKLVYEFGLQPDYQESDWGMHWSDNEQR